MKDLLTSFLSSTRSIADAEKSITKNHAHYFPFGLPLGTLLICAFLLNTNFSFARSNESGAASVSNVIAVPAISQWKSLVEYTAVITCMKVSTTKKLADPMLWSPGCTNKL